MAHRDVQPRASARSPVRQHVDLCWLHGARSSVRLPSKGQFQSTRPAATTGDLRFDEADDGVLRNFLLYMP